MAMRPDPKFGRDNYGYTSRLCAERYYVTKMQLNELSDESTDKYWKNYAVYADC